MHEPTRKLMIMYVPSRLLLLYKSCCLYLLLRNFILKQICVPLSLVLVLILWHVGVKTIYRLGLGRIGTGYVSLWQYLQNWIYDIGLGWLTYTNQMGKLYRKGKLPLTAATILNYLKLWGILLRLPLTSNQPKVCCFFFWSYKRFKSLIV